jgi:hypothetical protein
MMASYTLNPVHSAVRPAPALVALVAESSLWKRIVRFIWCTFLILTGQLVLAYCEPSIQKSHPKAACFAYVSVHPTSFAAWVYTLRSPPLDQSKFASV